MTEVCLPCDSLSDGERFVQRGASSVFLPPPHVWQRSVTYHIRTARRISFAPNDIVKNLFYKETEVFVFYECIVPLNYIRHIELLNNVGDEEGLLG